MVASWRPDVMLSVAFNADPNDPTAVRLWTDLSTGFLAAEEVTRGRQYELAQSQTAQPVVSIRDVDEYLNPANPASPYSPDVQPYREIMLQAMWPNGGTGNLINIAAWRVNSDPTFESYATGGSAALPAWVVQVGGPTDPAVMNAQSTHP
jgi:hypothetical protein